MKIPFKRETEKTEQARPEEAHHFPAFCYQAELVGTFLLVLIDGGMGLISSLSGGQISLTARAITPGIVVLFLIFSIGELSGAHLNPAVTLAFACRGVFPWRRVPLYWLVQVFGSVLAAVLLRIIFGNVGHLDGTEPVGGINLSFHLEIVLTFILVFVILSTSHQHKIKGPQAAFPVGAAIFACGLLGKSISGASMNPARSLGPALVSQNLNDIWIYLTGPSLGAMIAVVTVHFVHGKAKYSDKEAAQGEKNLRK